MTLLPSRRLIAHLDMNTFFASVEQQANRTLRDRPLGVCSYLGKHSCILAASVTAKRLGVRTGMTIEMAKQRVPEMRFLQADPVKYRSVSGRVFALLRELSDRVEPYSIDEAFVDFTDWYADELALIDPLLRVKERIRQEIGPVLTCSIGVAPTKALAKLASDHEKPNGFTMVSRASARDFLALHALTDVAGIGTRHARLLNRLGIFTLLEFVDYPTENLLRLHGKPLALLQAELQGCTGSTIEDVASPPQSIGHSYCVPRDVYARGRTLAVFLKLVEKASWRIRQAGRQAHGVRVSIGTYAENTPSQKTKRWRQQNMQSAYRTFPEPLWDRFSLTDEALRAFDEAWDGETPISFLDVTFGPLGALEQAARLGGPLFQLPATERKQRLTQALDQIQEKYGRGAVIRGQMIGLDQEAPDRIGFHAIEEQERNGVHATDAWDRAAKAVF